nr:tetratricopeptide repeat protein [Streptomyces antimycoticus]
MGRYRIITLSSSLTGSRYVGRRFPKSADNPYGLDRKTAALVAQVEAGQEEAAKSWPEPSPSRLADHPELRGERYQEAEDYWEFDFPDRALPVYEEVLAAHEAVLPADDTATLQLRQRVAEAYLAVGQPVAALALLAQTHAHLDRVLGPTHPDTRRASDDMTNARSQLGPLSRDEAKALAAELAELERTVGPDHPKALRTACALSSALQLNSLVQALKVLQETLDRSERALGTDHPDTRHVREELIRVCEYAEYRGKPDEVRAAVRARERVHGPDAPETLTTMRGLAQLYASSRRRKAKAVELLHDTLERCQRALGPDDPLTADVRRQLEELS